MRANWIADTRLTKFLSNHHRYYLNTTTTMAVIKSIGKLLVVKCHVGWKHSDRIVINDLR